MTPRLRAVLILAALFAGILILAAGLAYVGGISWRVDDLDQRVTRLETDVSLLRD